jgi:tRNA(Ser,Leu) C12 N-acetylase TAN1
MEQYKNKITGEEVFARKIPRNLTYPKVFYEIRISNKAEYISLTDFKKIYEKLNKLNK